MIKNVFGQYKHLLLIAIFVYLGIACSAQDYGYQFIDPTIQDFVNINPKVKLHYSHRGFSVDNVAVFEKYTLVFSQTMAKLYLLQNIDNTIVDEWSFETDGDIELYTVNWGETNEKVNILPLLGIEPQLLAQYLLLNL